jgi:hypothetical protein
LDSEEYSNFHKEEEVLIQSGIKFNIIDIGEEIYNESLIYNIIKLFRKE